MSFSACTPFDNANMDKLQVTGGQINVSAVTEIKALARQAHLIINIRLESLVLNWTPIHLNGLGHHEGPWGILRTRLRAKEQELVLERVLVGLPGRPPQRSWEFISVITLILLQRTREAPRGNMRWEEGHSFYGCPDKACQYQTSEWRQHLHEWDNACTPNSTGTQLQLTSLAVRKDNTGGHVPE